MKIVAALLLVACGLFAVQGSPQPPARPEDCCGMVQDALVDYARIKSGTSREEVEKVFQPAASFNSAGRTRYEYRKCPEIVAVIDFKTKPSKPGEFSPHDKVEGKSKLTLDFGVRD